MKLLVEILIGYLAGAIIGMVIVNILNSKEADLPLRPWWRIFLGYIPEGLGLRKWW